VRNPCHHPALQVRIMELGFLGFGQRGSAIAERLQDAGAELHLFDPNEATLAPFVAKGARAHASAAGVAEAARIVFACLPSGAISEAVGRVYGGLR
jgi:3-hydroxyisobutyrate dehydrogenase-like beta-hydroxyacid dehydrogenase